MLNLRCNKIEVIEGLETLINLEELNLSDNEISEIKGLENLTNLKYLLLFDNKIPKDKVIVYKKHYNFCLE